MSKRPPRPISVRESLQGHERPPTSPAEGAAEAGVSSAEAEAEAEAGVGVGVGVGFGAGVGVGSESGSESGSVPAVEPRILEASDGRWEVRSRGATRSGTGDDAGAPLLLLAFAREEAPEVPLREALVVGTSLEAIPDEDLEQHFARARPFTPPESRESARGPHRTSQKEPSQEL